MARPHLPLALLTLCAACATNGSGSPPPEEPWNCTPRLHLSSVWSFLSKKYDRDADGVVTAAEYGRGERQFDNYDRNRNGTLEADDFPEDTFFNGFNHMVVMKADADEDQRITRDEWRSFGQRLDPDADGVMVAGEVAPVLGPWAADWRLFLLSFDQDGDGTFTRADLEITFRDQDFDADGVLSGVETKGWTPPDRGRGNAPAPGSDAPDFTLAFAHDPSASFHLAEQVRGKPVALVFGSYT